MKNESVLCILTEVPQALINKPVSDTKSGLSCLFLLDYVCFTIKSTESLMKDIESGLFRGVTSEIVEAEIADAPKNVREQFLKFLKMNPEVLKISAETIGLVDIYLEYKILATRFRNDMLHIALSTIADVDILVSWNFRHIVRYDKIRQFNAVNLQQGYHTLDIYSPREVTSYEKD